VLTQEDATENGVGADVVGSSSERLDRLDLCIVELAGIEIGERKIYPGVWDVVKFKRILIELDSLGIGKFKETQLSQFPQRESGEVAVGLGNGLGIAAFASGGGFLDATIECGLGRSNVRRIFRRRFLWGDGL
jgi:hypothetical protein